MPRTSTSSDRLEASRQQSAILLPRQANCVLPQETKARPRGERRPSSGRARCPSCREASRGDVPAFRHERNDGNRRDEGAGRAQGAKNAEPLVPEACEEQGSDDDANTLSALCRPGLFLGIDDSELFQRERCGRGLSAPTNIDYHGYVIIKEPPPSPCQWIR